MIISKEERPILKIELSFTDKLFEIFGWTILIFLWAMIFLNYSKVPDTIPTHFNIAGKPDSFGKKTAIFILPIVSSVLFVGLTILNKFPHFFNYPVKITVQNAERLYTIATRLIRYLKFIILLTFTVIVFITSLTAGNKLSGLGVWFLPVFIVLIYVPLIYSIVKLFKAA